LILGRVQTGFEEKEINSSGRETKILKLPGSIRTFPIRIGKNARL
jgi:hypothetical protein